MVTWNKDSIIEINADEKRMSDIEKNMELMREAAEQDVAALDGHTQDKNNPHGVTYTQTGAAAAVHLHLPVTSTAGHFPVITQDGQFTDSGKGIDDFEAAGKADAVQAALDTHASSQENPHKVTKAQVGLGNCDNTSDKDKPISKAVENALLELKSEIPIYGELLEKKDIRIVVDNSEHYFGLDGICYGNGRYVAVGAISFRGTYIATTTEFENDVWESTKIPDTWENIKGKICFAGKYFWYLESVQGEPHNTGHILRSADGINWTEINAPYTQTLGIYYGKGAYFACPNYPGDPDDSNDMSMKTSTDGVLWKDCKFNGYKIQIKDFCYGNGIFVAIELYYVWISEDGFNWTAVAHQDDIGFWGGLSKIEFIDGEFYLLGYGDMIAKSKDARNWASFKIPISESYSNFYSICKGNGLFFLSGDEGIYVSVDLKDWTLKVDYKIKELLFADGSLIGISWGLSQLHHSKKTWLTRLAAKADKLETKMEKLKSSGIPENKFVIDFSLDIPTAHGASASSVAFGNGVAVAGLANGQIVFSTDNGYTWIGADAITESVGSIDLLCFGNDAFVAVSSGNKILTSADGKSWKVADFYASCRNLCFVKAIYNGFENRFCACFPTSLMSSEDGITWKEDSTRLTDSYSICYGDDIYVASTSEGITTTYFDNWTKTEANFIADYLCYGNGVFVAVDKTSSSSSKKIYTSSDGKKWELAVTASYIDTLSYGNGIFLGGPRDYAEICVSTDGKTWVPVPNLKEATGHPVPPIKNVCFTDGGFIGIRADGCIVVGTYANETKILMGRIKQLAAYVGYKW